MTDNVSPIHDGNRIALWEEDWAVHRLDLKIPIPWAVGRWLIHRSLYAKGNDFTSASAQNNPDYQGSSTLVRFWKGSIGSSTEGVKGVSLFILARKGVAQGVVCWTRTTLGEEVIPSQWFDKQPGHPLHHPKERIEVARLGHIMAFMKPAGRKKGLIRRAVNDFIIPELLPLAEKCKKQGVTPLVGASDAMEIIVGEACDLPITPYLYVCSSMKNQLWATISKSRMYPDRDLSERKWLSEPQPVPKRLRLKR